MHALGQVAHLDLAEEKPADTVRAAVNFHLKPNPIVITEAEIVPGDFHARFSATARRYRYLILNRRAPPALDRGRVWHVPVPLDDAAMADAAAAADRPPRLQQLPLDRLPGRLVRSRRSTSSTSRATAS